MKPLSKTHELKTDSPVFQLSWDGIKQYEIRLDDREFAVGDMVILQETKHSGDVMKFGAPLVYTGRYITSKITHILCAQYGLKDRWVVLSLANMKNSPKGKQ